MPKPLIVARYFAAQQRALDKAALVMETAGSALEAQRGHRGRKGRMVDAKLKPPFRLVRPRG